MKDEDESKALSSADLENEVVLIHMCSAIKQRIHPSSHPSSFKNAHKKCLTP
jgi:hypothetical protein